MGRHEFSKVRPQLFDGTISDPFAVYAAPEVLEDQLNFPQFWYDGDVLYSLYTDRLFRWDPDKYNHLRMKHFGDHAQSWHAPDMLKTKAFIEDYIDDVVEGFRIIRSAHAARGTPIWNFQTYRRGAHSPKQPVYSGQSGPLLILPIKNERSFGIVTP